MDRTIYVDALCHYDNKRVIHNGVRISEESYERIRQQEYEWLDNYKPSFEELWASDDLVIAYHQEEDEYLSLIHI